jgi:LuxR family maltose regulon positive regulatory protein
MERALDIAAATGILLPFLLDPAPALLERHRRHRATHSALATRILDLLARPAPPAPAEGPGGREGPWGYEGCEGYERHRETGSSPRLIPPLTASETYVLRYLPTRLTAQEIASELSLSVHTVTTHMRHLYGKLGVHRRRQAVEHARALGLLAPIPRGR